VLQGVIAAVGMICHGPGRSAGLESRPDFHRNKTMQKTLIVLALTALTMPVLAIDYGRLYESVDKQKATESVDTGKAIEAVQEQDIKKGYESVDKQKAAESVDTQKAMEALLK
jgi:hypothetical protein